MAKPVVVTSAHRFSCAVCGPSQVARGRVAVRFTTVLPSPGGFFQGEVEVACACGVKAGTGFVQGPAVTSFELSGVRPLFRADDDDVLGLPTLEEALRGEEDAHVRRVRAALVRAVQELAHVGRDENAAPPHVAKTPAGGWTQVAAVELLAALDLVTSEPTAEDPELVLERARLRWNAALHPKQDAGPRA